MIFCVLKNINVKKMRSLEKKRAKIVIRSKYIILILPNIISVNQQNMLEKIAEMA